MATKVELSEQVARYVARRAPEPRRQLRTALRALTKERGDIRALEGRLENYHRLRVGGYRVIFAYRFVGKQRTIQCIFAERRNVVYEESNLSLPRPGAPPRAIPASARDYRS